MHDLFNALGYCNVKKYRQEDNNSIEALGCGSRLRQVSRVRRELVYKLLRI